MNWSPWREGLGLFWICWLLAQIEIQIEGPHGWAERLPTWRWAPPWILCLTNGKPVTGYHASLLTFLLSIFHAPILLCGASLMLEVKILSAFFLMMVVWDFQWFAWNPAWGVRRFFRDQIWWFRIRIMGIPIDYFAGVAVSWACVAVLWPGGLGWWIRVASIQGGLTLMSVLLIPFIQS